MSSFFPPFSSDRADEYNTTCTTCGCSLPFSDANPHRCLASRMRISQVTMYERSEGNRKGRMKNVACAHSHSPGAAKACATDGLRDGLLTSATAVAADATSLLDLVTLYTSTRSAAKRGRACDVGDEAHCRPLPLCTGSSADGEETPVPPRNRESSGYLQTAAATYRGGNGDDATTMTDARGNGDGDVDPQIFRLASNVHHVAASLPPPGVANVDDDWHYELDYMQGPVSTARLACELADGTINSDTIIYHAGMSSEWANWKAAGWGEPTDVRPLAHLIHRSGPEQHARRTAAAATRSNGASTTGQPRYADHWLGIDVGIVNDATTRSAESPGQDYDDGVGDGDGQRSAEFSSSHSASPPRSSSLALPLPPPPPRPSSPTTTTAMETATEVTPVPRTAGCSTPPKPRGRRVSLLVGRHEQRSPQGRKHLRRQEEKLKHKFLKQKERCSP